MKSLTVGLVADPGLSTKVVEPLAADLPGAFTTEISDKVHWEVEVCSHALPLNDEGNIEVSRHSGTLKSRYGWDVVVCLTELTRRSGKTLVISEANAAEGTALISLPALGPIRLRHHVARALVHVIDTLAAEEIHGAGATNAAVELTRVRGRLRLLLGMVRVNRPWRLLLSLSSAIAAGIAAAAFGIFYSSIWNMADAMSPARLAAVGVVAVVAMMLWLTLYNGLWERPRDLDQRKNAALYNSATVLTLAAGVASMYLVLFTVVMLGALIIIPPDYLASTLEHPASWRDYAELAWLASSLGTFAGALGSSFESDYAVRNATYGKREQERHARAAALTPADS
ncbi:hypothetical protein [Mycolicibacterium sp. XJ870]